VEIRLLGPVEVIDDDGALVALASARQRLLVAGLCVQAGHVVAADTLVELLWGDTLPADPAAALQSQMSRLRRRLGPAAAIATVPGGYRVANPDIVDVVRFRRLLERARRGAEGVAAVEEALALWRGRPLADLDCPQLADAVSALEDERGEATERWIGALTDSGRYTEAAAAAAALARALPFRERPVALHMDALAKSGRPGDALRVYESFRRDLADELGLDPSAELRDVHQRVLEAGTDPTHRARPAPPRTSLVGRDETLAALIARLDQAGLVTLTGPGGVGKTRLAVHAMHAVEPWFRDGHWFCDLAALPPGGPVENAVATALGIDVQDSGRAADRILGYLAPRQTLVTLDNCEHVLDAAAGLVSRILQAAPAATILATSRERLRVEGEQRFPVEPLDTSDRDGDAIRLFADRALAVNPSFRLGPVRSDVAELCRMLGGLPLAIEMAATATATRTPADLLIELRSRGGQMAAERERPARHASLHAVMAWSYELLAPVEAELFERLAVFHAGWHADAAAAVAPPKEPGVIDGVLDRLAERSLITCNVTGPRTRWGLLEPVRAYAAARLRQRGQHAAAHDRHALFFADLLERASAGLTGPAEPSWAENLSVELHNLRAAHRWLVDNDRRHDALRLASACYPWVFAGAPAEVGGWAREAAQRFGGTGDPGLVGVLATSAAAAWRQGDADMAISLAARGAELGRTAPPGGPPPATRWALDALGDASIIAGRYDEAIDAYQDALALAEAAGDPVTLCNAMGSIALAFAYQGKTADAIAQADAVVARTASIDNPSTQGWAHYFAGETRLDTEPGVALPMLRRAVTEAERAGNRFLLGVSLVSLVSLQARTGDAAGTLPRFRWLISHWQQTGAWSQLWITIRSLIEALHRTGHPDLAAVLYGALRTSPTASRPAGPDARRLALIERDLAAQLGAAKFQSLRAEGAAMSDGDALSYTLAKLPASAALA